MAAQKTSVDAKVLMRTSTDALRKFIREVVSLDEVDINDIENFKSKSGSTHKVGTCTIKGRPAMFYLKFSDNDLFEEGDPSMQILIEYLAYKIYQLYPGVPTPSVELVYDKSKNRVGLASSEVKGKSGTTISANKLGKMMSAGVYVDILLANWDAVGTEPTLNVIVTDKAVRIDPGGSLTYRAQGGRKGEKFSKEPGELKTMMNPKTGAGRYFQHADLREAIDTFMSVTWSQIQSKISSVDAEVSKELKKNGMSQLLREWKTDVAEILTKLSSRHATILASVGGT